jgi:hypothetical protein
VPTPAPINCARANPGLIHLGGGAAFMSTAMTIRVNTHSRQRVAALAAHAYSTPVVRELPKPPADAGAADTW